MKNIFKLYKYLDSYLWKLITVVLISSLAALMDAVMPLVVRQIIIIITQSTKNLHQVSLTVVFLLSLILIAGIIGNISNYFQDKYRNLLGIEVARRIRNKVFDITLRLSPAYTEMEGAGSIVQRINEGTSDFRNWLGSAIYVISNIVYAIIAFVIIFSKSLPAAIIFCVIFGPAIIYITVQRVQRTRPLYKKWQEAGSKLMGLLSETLSNLATVKSLSSEAALAKKNSVATQESFEIANETQAVERRFGAARDTATSLYQFVAISFATVSAIYGKLSPADIFVFAYFASNLAGSLNPIASFIQTTTETEVAAGRLIEFLESAPIVVDKPDALPLIKLDSIEFKGVSFTYPEGKKGAIHNISFKISGDKTVALVGPSGTGKSTITKLLLRFYDPTEGEILINDQDVSDFTQDSVRQHLGVVMQDVALFNTTIEENLGIAKAQATKRQIQLAAQQAHADAFIADFPKGYKTIVGERGIRLSGGQKQRVAIARAILKDPQLIILDEATSALDSESERLVQDGLKKLLKGRSALIIAHRLSTIMHADEILVLKGGKVAERGNHEQLINATGLYKKLFDLQSSSGKVKL